MDTNGPSLERPLDDLIEIKVCAEGAGPIIASRSVFESLVNKGYLAPIPGKEGTFRLSKEGIEKASR